MLSTRVSADLDYFCDDNVDLLTSAVTQLNIDAGYVLRNDGKVMNNKGVEAPDLASATGDDLSNDPDSTDEIVWVLFDSRTKAAYDRVLENVMDN